VNPKEVRVVPDGQTVEMPFRRGVMLRGVVVDANGDPLAGVNVGVMTQEGVSQNDVSDEDGQFETPSMPGTDHMVAANYTDQDGRRFDTLLKEVRPEQGEVRVVIQTR
jgi:hypothetical protein